MTTADTARRERAEKWAKSFWEQTPKEIIGKHPTVEAYIAGAREEAAEKDKEIAALRDVVSLQGSALREIRIRLHAFGRRPEECYEMSILDDTIAAVRHALEEKR